MSDGDPPPGVAPQLDAYWGGQRSDAPYRLGDPVWCHWQGVDLEAAVTALQALPTGGWAIWATTMRGRTQHLALYDAVGHPYSDEWLIPRAAAEP